MKKKPKIISLEKIHLLEIENYKQNKTQNKKYEIFKNTIFLNQQWVIKINIKRVIKSHISTIWEKRKNGMGSIIDWKWEVYQSESSIFLFQSICIFIKFSNILRKVSGPVVGSVESVQNHIFPWPSLYFLPKSTVAPKAQRLGLFMGI